MSADSSFGVVQIQLRQTEEREVRISMVAIATIGTSASDIAELIDIDSLIEILHVRDIWRAGLLHETALVLSRICSEEC